MWPFTFWIMFCSQQKSWRVWKEDYLVFSPEIQSLPFVSLSVPCGKAQAELKDTKEINDNEILSNLPNWLVLWLHPMPITIMICKLTVSPGSQLPPNHAKRFKPQMETVGSAWKCDFPHQKFFFSYLNLVSKTGLLKGICNETFLALFPWLKCERFIKCIHCHNIFILWS